MHKAQDINTAGLSLFEKGYSTKELVGKKIIIEAIEIKEGDSGEFLLVTLKGEIKKLATGSHNVVAKLKQAQAQDLFPMEVTITQFGNAFDLE